MSLFYLPSIQIPTNFLYILIIQTAANTKLYINDHISGIASSNKFYLQTVSIFMINYLYSISFHKLQKFILIYLFLVLQLISPRKYLNSNFIYQIDSSYLEMQFSNIEGSLICPVFSPCSNLFVTINNNNVYVKQASLDLKNRSQILLNQTKANEGIPILKFSPNSQLLALYFKKKIFVYDTLGSLKIKIRDQQNNIEGMIWCSDSKHILVFFSNNYHCTIYNILNEVQSLIRNPKFPDQKGCTFSKGSQPGIFTAFLEKQNSKDCIGIYFTQTWQLVNYITLQTFDAARIQFTENGKILVIQNKINFKVFIVDMYQGVEQIYGNKDYVMGICCHKFSNTQAFLALGAHDDCVHLLNTTTWKLIAELQITGEIDCNKTILFRQQADGKFLPVQGGRFKTKKQQQSGIVPGISIIQFSSNDQYFAVKIDTMINCVFVYAVRSLDLVSVVLLNGKTIMRDFKWLQGDRNHQLSTLCMGYGTSSLLFWRESSEDGLFEIEVPKTNTSQIKIGKIQKGNNGKLIFYSNSMKRYVFAIKSQEEQYQ